MLRCSGLASRRAYHVARVSPQLKQHYTSIADYGSYRNQAYTHRLPESTAKQSPPLVALSARLALPADYSLSTLSQALNMDRSGELVTNFGLATLGKSFLSYYVSEHLLVKYPRLPMAVHNEAVNAYMGPTALAEVGKSWGIEADTRSKLDKHLAGESHVLSYGRLRFQSEREKSLPTEDGVYELSRRELASMRATGTGASFVPKQTEAYASAVKSIIGGLYTHCGEDATKQFINNHILSRKLPLDSMFQFSQPTRELVRVCEKEGMTAAVEIRLIAETGRKSAHPIYIAGAFCGTDKLGEGAGSSLREAKTRAVVNALMGYYLYSPITADGAAAPVPSDADYRFTGVVGQGDVAI
ncbi:large ribosomal subunit protein mL44 [Diutina catenulata]